MWQASFRMKLVNSDHIYRQATNHDFIITSVGEVNNLLYNSHLRCGVRLR